MKYSETEANNETQRITIQKTQYSNFNTQTVMYKHQNTKIN